jgi:hypothetical protein
MVGIAEQVKVRLAGDESVQSGHAVQMTHFVLRQAARPAADNVEVGYGQSAEDFFQFRQRLLG